MEHLLTEGQIRICKGCIKISRSRHGRYAYIEYWLNKYGSGKRYTYNDLALAVDRTLKKETLVNVLVLHADNEAHIVL